jgi:WD40 repeat protein
MSEQPTIYGTSGELPDRFEFWVGGSLPLEARSYVRRQADEDFYAGLKRGDFCYVLNARQMGKSSLRVRTMARLQAEGTVCVAIDMTAIGSTEVTADQWYFGLLSEMLEQVREQTDRLGDWDFDALVDWWEARARLPFVQRWIGFMESVLLERLVQPLVIFVDEIDSVLGLPFRADDFFAAIRACHDRRANEPRFRRLTFAFLGVCAPQDLIQDVQRTPFNVGRAIELSGFGLDEVAPLQAGLGMGREVMVEILAWTGGQPFLTQKLCELVRRAIPPSPPSKGGDMSGAIAAIVQSEIVENWEGKDDKIHLRTIQGQVLKVGEAQAGRLLGLYQQVLAREDGLESDDSAEQVQLRLSGLVVKRDGRLRVFNRIYQAVFDRDWVVTELAKLRPAYYGAAISEWLKSGDESVLLRGEALRDGLNWAQGKQLSDEDSRFLRESQEAENQAEKEANQILTVAREQAETELSAANQQLGKVRRRTAVTAAGAIGALVVAGIAVPSSIMAQKAVRNAQKEIQDAKEQKEKLESTNNELTKQGESLNGQLKLTQEKEKAAQQKVQVAQQQYQKAQQQEKEAKVQASEAIQQSQAAQQQSSIAQQQAVAATQQLAQVNQEKEGAMRAKAEAENKLQVANQQIAVADQQLETAQVQAAAAAQVAQDAEQKTKLANRMLQAVGIQVDAAKAQSEGLVGRQLLGLVQGIRAAGMYQQLSAQLQGGDAQREIIEAKLQTQAVLTNVYGIQEHNILQANQGIVSSVNFSPDGQTIVSGGEDGTVKLWNRDGSERVTLKGHQDRVSSVNFSPDGQTIVSGGEDGTVKLWNRDGSERATLKANRSIVTSVNFSPDGQTIVSGGYDGTVKLWNVNGNERATLEANQGIVTSVNFSPDGQTIVSGGADGTVKLWNRDGSERVTLKGHQGRVWNVNFSPDGQTVVSGGADGMVKLWNIDGSERATLKGHRDRVNNVNFSPDGQTIVSGGEDDTVKLWNIDGSERVTLKGHQVSVLSVNFSRDGQTIVSGGFDGTVKLWNVNGNERATLKANQGRIRSVNFSPDGQTIVSGGADGTMKLWNRDGSERATLKANQGNIYSVNFSRDGQTIVSGGADGTVKLWNQDGSERAMLKGNQGSILSVNFSPDGQTIVSGGADGTVKLWNQNGSERATLRGNQYSVKSVNFSPDGQTIVSGGADGTMKLWNRDGSERATLKDHESDVRSVNFSPDGQTIVSGGVDGTVKLVAWDVAQLLKLSCDWASDYLRMSPDVNDEDRAICGIQK